MITRWHSIISIISICVLSFVSDCVAQKSIDDRHIEVALRMIGDEILLNAGDSISRVLAIEKDLDRYKIQFESNFHFDPEQLVASVDQVVKKTAIARSYLVQIETCDSHKVIYSYEIGHSNKTDLVPCQTRLQPNDCYELYITILNTELLVDSQPSSGLLFNEGKTNYFFTSLLFLGTLFLIGLPIYWKKRKNSIQPNPDLIPIGKYHFDKRNLTLSFEEESIELSNREAELLFLLYTSENKILKREHLLKIVWGDEGDYIGRTLDVFISKLRKKLVADSSLKIVNVRGVGYKFVMSSQN